MARPENKRYLSANRFFFDRRQFRWVKIVRGRECVIQFEDAVDHDLDWLKTRIAELMTALALRPGKSSSEAR